MKLIDMLVEEGLSGWRWPEGYYSVAQDKNDTYWGNIYAYINALSFGDYWSEDNDSGFGLLLFKGYEVAEDAATSLVTREQYEDALAARNEGWIEWGGGDCPVEDFLKVEYQLRGGAKGSESAKILEWQHEGGRHDIIAYRLHKPQEAVQGESSLNDCIEQDAAPVWNGEGLPPVGCFCEITDPNGMLVYGQGEAGEVIAHVENTAVIRMSYGLGCFEAGFLRPLRTEAELKREEARKAIYAAMNIIDGDIADAIYDAIASGKIPGVKLED